MSENTNLPIVKTESVQQIAQLTPDAYGKNNLAVLKCNELGEALLAKINAHGMSDALDQECASYIERAKTSVKRMNERRAPITKLFDQIRSAFTSMESRVDVTKQGSIPYAIQQHRNEYAAKKRAEAERLRQEEMRRQQHEQSLNRYKQDAEDDYRRQFDNKVTSDINELTSLNQSLSIENFEQVSAKIKGYHIDLGNEWFQNAPSYAHKPIDLTDAEAIQIRQGILNRLAAKFKEQYKVEVGEYRDSIADALPSKKRELERMAQANAEEKARMEAELKAREAAEARRLEEERKRKEEEARAQKQLQAQSNEMDGLFGQAAVAQPVGYQPKTSVKYRVKALTADGILQIVGMWWSKEGQYLPLDELEKMFKKQFTFVNKLANDKTPDFIKSEFVTYEEEVKAK